MSYSSNPYIAKARMQARNDVVMGRLTVSEASRRYGVHRTTIWRWIKKYEELGIGSNGFLWTEPSIPKHHPNETKAEVVKEIIDLRLKIGRCAPVIQSYLKRRGISIGISTVGKILRKHKLTRKKKQLKDYRPFPRPVSDSLGSFVEMDTIHIVRSDYRRVYIYTLIDVFSRLAYAEYRRNLSNKASLEVVLNAQKYFGFKFKVVQTDNGCEFSPTFGYKLNQIKIKLRHSRIRKPNDNAHIERFNRTIQDEGLKGNLNDEEILKKKIKKFNEYYNYKRLHLSLNCLTPFEYVAKVSN